MSKGTVKTTTKVTKTLVEYIQRMSMTGEWIPIKVKEAQKMLKMSNASIVCKVLNEIKDLPTIEWQLIQTAGAGRSIRHYRYIDPENKPAVLEKTPQLMLTEAPVEASIEETTVVIGKQLTPAQVQRIMDKLISVDDRINRKDKSRFMQVINLLRLLKTETESFEDYLLKITELLPISVADAQRYVNALVLAGYAKVTGNSVRLFLNGDIPSDEPAGVVLHQLAGGRTLELQTNPTEDVESFNPLVLVGEITAEVEPVEELIGTSDLESEREKAVEKLYKENDPIVNEEVDSETENREISELLIRNIKEFSEYQAGFQNLLSGALAHLTANSPATAEALLAQEEAANDALRVKQELDDEIIKLKQDLEQGGNAMQKMLSYNKQLSLQNEDYKEEARVAKKKLQGFQYQNEKFHSNMQERFQIVIAEITNSVSEYNQTPEYKLNPAIKARFQNVVISAITSAIDDILNYSSTD